jgi:hypothetical protein
MAELTLAKVGQVALTELEELTGCPAEGVTAIDATEDGWSVDVDVRELARVPETTDVLATYRVTIDGGGRMTGYRRVRRYLRAQVED